MVIPSRLLLVAILLGLAASRLAAQELKIVPYRVQGYNIDEVGYPSDMVSTGYEQDFAYVEWWERGQVRSSANFYLQFMRPSRKKSGGWNYDEVNAVPLTRPDEGQMKFKSLHALDGHLAVVGNMTNDRGEPTLKMQIFTRSGSRKGKPTTLTPFRKELDEHTHLIRTAPDGSHIAWLGLPNEQNPKETAYYAVCYTAEGRLAWREQIRVPNPGDDHVLTDYAVDKRGNLFLLMEDAEPEGTMADRETPPRVVWYKSKAQKFEIIDLKLPGYSYAYVDFHIAEGDQLVVGAATSKQDGPQLKNGSQLDEGERAWSNFSYRRFNIMRNMLLEAQTDTDVPDSLVKRYEETEDGANFSTSRFIVAGEQVFWLLEEHFTKGKLRGTMFANYDVGVLSFDRTAGDLQWASFMDKQQRDFGSRQFLGYSPAVTETFLHLAYLTERGASGKVRMASVNRNSGGLLKKTIISNQTGRFTFFPRRHIQLQERLLMIGMGDPSKQEYYLLQIEQLP